MMPEAHVPSGVLVVDKPEGLTSAKVVAEVKRRLGGVKVGHTGTLDPMATGVLPLVVGAATKIAGFLLAHDKSYSGTIVLGVETDTFDREGQVVVEHRDAAAEIDCAAVEQAVSTLRGAIEQVPPMYSAIRHQGRRLHELARAGQRVERAPRAVTVSRFDITRCAPPRLDFEVECSSGTYVRSLARDLGRALGVGAHLGSLRRRSVGNFDLSMAVPLSEVSAELAAQRLVPIAQALAAIPRVEVGPELVPKVVTGLRIEADRVPGVPEEGVLFQIVDGAQALLALARVDGGRLRYERVFAAPGAGGGNG